MNDGLEEKCKEAGEFMTGKGFGSRKLHDGMTKIS